MSFSFAKSPRMEPTSPIAHEDGSLPPSPVPSLSHWAESTLNAPLGSPVQTATGVFVYPSHLERPQPSASAQSPFSASLRSTVGTSTRLSGSSIDHGSQPQASAQLFGSKSATTSLFGVPPPPSGLKGISFGSSLFRHPDPVVGAELQDESTPNAKAPDNNAAPSQPDSSSYVVGSKPPGLFGADFGASLQAAVEERETPKYSTGSSSGALSRPTISSVENVPQSTRAENAHKKTESLENEEIAIALGKISKLSIFRQSDDAMSKVWAQPKCGFCNTLQSHTLRSFLCNSIPGSARCVYCQWHGLPCTANGSYQPWTSKSDVGNLFPRITSQPNRQNVPEQFPLVIADSRGESENLEFLVPFFDIQISTTDGRAGWFWLQWDQLLFSLETISLYCAQNEPVWQKACPRMKGWVKLWEQIRKETLAHNAMSLPLTDCSI